MNINLDIETLYVELFDRAKKAVFKTELFRIEAVAHDIAIDFIYSDTFKLFDSTKGNLEQFFIGYVKAWIGYQIKDFHRNKKRLSFFDPGLDETFFGYNGDFKYTNKFERKIDAVMVIEKYKKLLSEIDFKGVNLGIFFDLLIESTDVRSSHWSNDVKVNFKWCGKQLGKNVKTVNSIYEKMVDLVRDYERI